MTFCGLLLIENDRSNQLAVQQCVDQGKLASHCEYATSLADARTKLTNQAFDCAILQVGMVDDSIPALLADLSDRGIPLVVLARPGQEDAVIHLMAQGASDYLIQDPDRHYLKLLSVSLRKAIATAHTKRQLIDITQQQAIEQQFLRTVIDAVPNRIFVKDDGGQYLLVNQEMADFYGTTVENLLSKRDTDCRLDANTIGHFALENRRVIDTGQELFIPEERDVDHRGEERWLQWHKLPIRLPGHSNRVVLGVGTDITQHKQTLQKIEFQASLLDQVHNAVIATDLNGQIVYWNHYAEVMYQWCAEEVIGTALVKVLIPLAGKTTSTRILARLQRQGHWEGEVEVYCKDGTLLPIQMAANSAWNQQGELIGYITVSSDIRDRRQHEAERDRQERLLEAQRRVLELLALDTPLAAILTLLVQLTEAQTNGQIGSILLLEGHHLRHGAAPGLPEAYNQAVDGIEIGPQAGSCGTAAYLQEPVIVTDIATDPRWEKYRNSALLHGLRACWSVPILSRTGMVLGTFALYHREPYTPNSQDRKLIRVAVNLAALAIERKQTERCLHESEERFRVTFEQAAIGICHVSPEGRLLRFNQRFCEISGYTAAELHHLTFQEITYPEDLPADFQQLYRLLKGQVATYTSEKRYIRKDRTVVWVNLTVSLVRDEAGKPSYLIGIVEDIADRKEAAVKLYESEQRYASLAEAAPVGIFRTDMTGLCVYVNDRWGQIAGVSAEQAMGNGWLEALHPDDREAVAIAWVTAAQAQQPFQLEYRFQRPNGTISWVYGQAIAEYSPDGTVTGFVGTITDITDRKQAETALHQLNQELERRVEARTAELQQTNRELQAAIAERQKLAALVENSTDFIVTATSDGQVAYLNQAGRHLVGLDDTADITNYVIADFHFPEDWDDLQQTMLPMLERGESWQGEIRLRHFQTGIAIPMMHSAFPIKHPRTGETLAIAGILRDITERKHIEQQLRDLSDRLTLAVTAGGIGIWEWDITRNEVIWDDRMYELYGLRRGVFTNVYDAWIAAIHPDDRPQAELISQQARRGERDYNTEFRVIHTDGSIHYLQAYALIQRAPSGEPLRMVGMNFDITDRKQAEIALRESEQRYATLTEAAPVAIFRFNTAGECIYVNDRWSEITGQPSSTGLGLGWLETIHPEDREWLCAKVMQWTATCCIGDLYRQEARTLRPDGSILWFDCQMLPETDANGTIIGYIGTLADISDRKLAEAALRESQERWQLAIAGANDGIWDWNVKTNTVFLSPRWQEIRGFRDAEVISSLDVWLAGIHPDDYEAVMAGIADHFAGNTEFFEMEYRVRCQDGSYKWILDRAKALRNESGHVIRMAGSETDITQRKLAETALRESEAWSRSLMEGAGDAIILSDLDGHCLTGNRKAEELLGYTRDEISHLTISHIHPLAELERRAAEFSNIVQTGFGQVIDATILRRDGTLVPVDITASVVTVGHKQVVLGSIRDTTERKVAELALRDSEARFRSYFELSFIGMAITSPEKGWVEVNDRLCEILGYLREELTQLTWTEITYPDDLAVDLASFNRVVAGEMDGYTLDKRFIRKDGTIIYASISARCLRKNDHSVDYFVALVQDITARKQAEERLRESESSLLQAQRVAHIGNWSFDLSNQAITWSEELYRMFGLDPSQPPPSYADYLTKIHPDDRPALLQCVETAIAEGTSYTIDYQAVLPDGSIRYHEGRGEAIQDQSGRVVKLLGTALDITDRKQVELELQRNQDLREAIFERSTDALFIVNPVNELIMDCNQRAVEMFEATDKKELLNLCGNTLQHYPFSPSELEVIITEVAAKGSWSQELEYVTLRGKPFWASIAGTKISVANQEVQLVRLSDITIRKEIEQLLHQQLNKEQLLVSVLMRTRDSLEISAILAATAQEVRQVLSVDRILFYRFNDDYSGRVVAEACVPPWYPMLNLEFSVEPFPADCFQRYIEGEYYLVEDCHTANMAECARQFMTDFQIRAKLVVPIVQQENKKLWGLLIAHQCSTGREWDFWEIGLLHQLTGQLAIAIQQADLYQQLQAELAERQRAEAILQSTNEQLQIANRDLARATQLKDEFLANMSHELRTPLNAILGMSETLQDQVFGALNDQQQKAVNTIERSGRHLLDLINDILDLAKIEAGKLELQLNPCSVRTLCTSSLNLVKQIAYKKNIHLSSVIAPELDDIEIDERRMRQVLVNLLSNAIKFTSDGGTVALEVWSQPAAAPSGIADSLPYPPTAATNFVYFSVLDTGIGIAADDIAKLFQAFVQIDSKLNRQYNGTGLGLALVKRISELHHGWVQVESTPGQGSRFTVVLPYQPAPQTVWKPSSQTNTESQLSNFARQVVPGEVVKRQPLILLAEDNQANIETYSNYLMNCGYRLVVATNGLEAVSMAQQHRPDVILMDIQMPAMDGLEAARQIRALKDLTCIPMIALTALAMPGDRERCLAAGMNDYLAKPVRLRHLVNRIAQLLEP